MHLGRVFRRARYLSQGERLSEAGDFDQALVVYDEGLSALPNDGHFLLHKALAQANAGQPGEAKSTLHEAMELCPRQSVYPLFLGQVHYDLGETEEALDAFQLASRLDPSNDLIKAYLGLTAMTLGQVDEGYAALVERVRAANAGCQGRVLLCCEAYLARHSGASQPLEQLVSKKEGEARSRGLLGPIADAMERGLIRAWHGAARPLTALRYLSNAAARRARTLFLEGSLRYDLEEYEAAWVAFSESLKAESGRALTRLRLADLCLQKRDYAGALGWLTDLQEERGEWQPAILEIEGLALFHEGRHAEALGKLSDLVALQPREYLSPYYVGLCHLRVGDSHSARIWFEKAAGRLNPGIVRLRLEEMMRVRRMVSGE